MLLGRRHLDGGVRPSCHGMAAGHVLSARDSMNRPFPLPSDVKHARASVYLIRAACCHLRSFTGGRGATPESVARAMFGSGDVVTPEILRSATTQATTTTSGWAKE